MDTNEENSNKPYVVKLKVLLIFAFIIVCIIVFGILRYRGEMQRKEYEKLSRNIFKTMEVNYNLDTKEICKILDISEEDFNRVYYTYLKDVNAHLEQFGVAISEESEEIKKENFNKLENYILYSNYKNAKIVYEGIKEKIEDEIYRKWYSNVISGFINYHLGGTITSSDIHLLNDKTRNPGEITIDNMYHVKFSMSGNLGGINLSIDNDVTGLNNYSFDTIDDTKLRASDTTGKPIIYIYPEEETLVNVKLGHKEYLTCSYPKYEDDGWNVIAEPNGDLEDVDTGRKLYALYWECKSPKQYDYSNLNDLEGFVIKGEDTAKFLEEKLEILGLNEREAEEFIVYWLPRMEPNKYNYIRFETREEIDNNMPLDIEPTPDKTIRIIMDWKGLDEEISVKEQTLEKKERNGYTVVEWGGSEIE